MAGYCSNFFCGTGVCCRKGFSGCGDMGCVDYHCCTETAAPTPPPPVPPLPPVPPTPPSPPPPPPQTPLHGLLSDVLNLACIDHPVLGAWVAAKLREYLASPGWWWTVHWSFDEYRPWFAKGLPDALAQMAEWQVWGGGYLVKEFWWRLPPGEAGITRLAITSVECDSFSMRSVDAQYCFPFEVSGRALGIDLSCRGEWLMELAEPLQPLAGLVEANATGAPLTGSWEMTLAPESWFELSSLDMQGRELFDAQSVCEFHAVPQLTMRLGSVRFDADDVLVETQAVPGRPSLNATHPTYIKAAVAMRAARYLLQSIASCALGYGDGAGYFNDFLGAVPVAPHCPDAQAFLCANTIVPSVTRAGQDIWYVLHASLFLTPQRLRVLFFAAAIASLLLTYLALPGLSASLQRRQEPQLTAAALREQEAVLRLQLQQGELRSRLQAEICQELSLGEADGESGGDGPQAADAPPAGCDRRSMDEASGGSSQAGDAPVLTRSVVDGLDWFLSTRLVRCALATSRLSLAAAASLFVFLAGTVLLFGLLTLGFICTALVLTEEWCYDHSIQTALPEAAAAATAAAAAACVVGARRLAGAGLERVLAAVLLQLCLLSVALGLRASVRLYVSHYHLSYRLVMAFSDVAKVGTYVGVYRLALALRELFERNRAPRRTLLDPTSVPSHRWTSAQSLRGASRRSGLAEAPEPLVALVRSLSVAELRSRTAVLRLGKSFKRARGEVGGRVGLREKRSLVWLDAMALILLYVLLTGVSDRVHLAVIALAGAYATIKVLRELETELLARAAEQAAGASAWCRCRAHFCGGGGEARAARWLWWSFALKLLSIVATAVLEPLCLQQPCLLHQSACPLPYRLNHLSLGYAIDCVGVSLLLIGTLALVAQHAWGRRNAAAGADDADAAAGGGRAES